MLTSRRQTITSSQPWYLDVTTQRCAYVTLTLTSKFASPAMDVVMTTSEQR